MKAIVCNDFGPIKNIKYMDVENPEIDDESILINVRSVGVNFPDGLLVQGKYQLKPETPFIPGMEVSGEIIELGSKVLDFAFINVGNFRSNPDKVKILMVLSELESSKKAFLGAPTIADLDVDVGLSDLGPMGWTWWIVNPDTPAELVIAIPIASDARPFCANG